MDSQEKNTVIQSPNTLIQDSQKRVVDSHFAQYSKNIFARGIAIAKTISIKYWIYGGLAIPLCVIAGNAWNRTTEVPKPQTISVTPSQIDEKLYFESNDPLSQTASTNQNLQSSEAKKILATAIINYDKNIVASLDKNFGSYLSSASVYYRDAAITEAQGKTETGKIGNDPLTEATIDMSTCPFQTDAAYKCILLRYMIESARDIQIVQSQPINGENISKLATAYIKGRSSMIAFGGNAQMREYDFNSVSKGILKQARAMRQWATIRTAVQTLTPVEALAPGINANQIQVTPAMIEVGTQVTESK